MDTYICVHFKSQFHFFEYERMQEAQHCESGSRGTKIDAKLSFRERLQYGTLSEIVFSRNGVHHLWAG